MSFFKVGDKFGVNQANLMKKLGYEDVTAAGNGEVRLFKDGSDYMLKVWNGSVWEAIGQVDVLKKDGVVRVIASTSGADINGNLIVNGSLSVTGEIHPPSLPAGFKEFGKGLHLFQVPGNCTQLKVTVSGAGGGGSAGYGGAAYNSGNGGGAGQWVKEHVISVTPGELIPINVGKGGTGGNPSLGLGFKGGDTVFGKYLSVEGGYSGGYSYRNSAGGGAYNGGSRGSSGYNGSAGGDSVIDSIFHNGAGGGGGLYYSNSNENKVLYGGNGGSDTTAGTTGGNKGLIGHYGASGGGGGAGLGGNGGNGGTVESSSGSTGANIPSYDGKEAAGYGAGGGGGGSLGISPHFWGKGGNGGDGYCKVEWGF